MNIVYSFLLTTLFCCIVITDATTMNSWKRFEISRMNDYLHFMEIELYLNNTKISNDELIYSMSSVYYHYDISNCFDNNIDTQCHSMTDNPIIYVESNNTVFDRISITNRDYNNVNNVFIKIYSTNDMLVFDSSFPTDFSEYRHAFEFEGNIIYNNLCISIYIINYIYIIDICEFGSVYFGSDCWCMNGFYSNNGIGLCDQCNEGQASKLYIGKSIYIYLLV
jgi:hypothetical protein